MARQNIEATDILDIGRGKINSNFTELYDRNTYVEDFGTIGDGNDRAVIQTAIDFCLVNSIKTLNFRPVTYTIDGPLIVARIVTDAYTSFNLDLTGSVNANAGITNQATRILCTHKNTFAIGLQNARSCTISNILVQGAYSYTKTFKEIAEGDNNDWTVVDVRDEIYSPYSGISVDPFGTSVPVDGGYPGLTSYYKASAAGSSGVSVRNCTLTNFVVGYSISNNGTTPNAESINIYNTRIYNTKVAWASGQSQTRGCAMDDCAVFSCLTAIDTVSYGVGTGSAPVVKNLIVSKAKNIVNIAVNRGVFSGSDIYAEETWKIGVVFGDKVANFRNCTFKFNYGNSPDFVKAPDSYLSGGGKASFYSCDFTKSGDQNYNVPFGNITASFYNCNFEAKNPPFNSTLGSLNFYDCTCFGIKLTQGQQYISSGGGFFSYNGVSLQKTSGSLSRSVNHKVQSTGLRQANIGSVAITTISGTTATFTPASVTTIKVGDSIVATSTPYNFYFQDSSQDNSSTLNINTSPVLGTVQSIVGGIVTIKDTPYDLVSGTFSLLNQWCDVYNGMLFGTTNGTTTISNVHKESSQSLVGQRIFSADPSQFTIGLYVVSEDVNARTLTMSGAMGAFSSIGLYSAYFDSEIIVSSDPSTITGQYYDKSTLIRTKGQVLSDKLYFTTTGGIVGNVTHTPVFKTATIS
jgi:hypothetical protein